MNEDIMEDTPSNSHSGTAGNPSLMAFEKFSSNAAVIMMLAGSSVAAAQGIESCESATRYDSEARSFYARAFTVSQDTAEAAAVGRVRELAQRPNDWKGPGSRAASQAAKIDAENFARAHVSNHLATPSVGLDPEGDYSFYWRTRFIEIDVAVCGDGTYSFFARLQNGQSYEGDELPIEHPLPAAVREALAAPAV
jgi:hypothetical protein